MGPCSYEFYVWCKIFLILINDFSRFAWLYPMKLKAKMYHKVCQFVAMVERQFSTKVKFFQSYQGGEFRNLNTFTKDYGMEHKIVCAHTHQQNGTVERKIGHIVDTGLTMLAYFKVPLKFQEYVFAAAVHIINRLPSSVIANIFPFEKLFEGEPDYNTLRIFGCTVYQLLRPYNANKFSLGNTPCVFLGHSSDHWEVIYFLS